MTTDCLEFAVEMSGASRTQALRVYIRAPAILDAYPDRWTCIVGWNGPTAQERPVFGASALQAVALAVPVLEALLRANFPEAGFLADGKPFLH